jgi:hypothetical protein
MNFYIAQEDDAKYKDVCDYRKKPNETNKNVISAFSGLECPGKELHEWESDYKLYREKFKKGKQCLQRRISTMKKYPARSNRNKESRKKHIYPITVAYSYAKDCLKKIGSKKEQDIFQKSVDELISKMAEKQPNIREYFDGSIEDLIRSRHNDVSAILDRPYYDNIQTNIINKQRNIGYNKLNEADRDLYMSILNEGFTRNATKANEFLKEEEEENENKNENTYKKEIIKTIKKNLRKRRNTKKKPVAITEVNLTNLNAYLQSNAFRITNEERRKDLIKRIDDISDLLTQLLLLKNREVEVRDIYEETFKKFDKLNKNIIGLQKAHLDDKNIERIKLVQARTKLGENFHKIHNNLRERIFKIEDEFYEKKKTGNSTTDTILKTFIRDSLYIYTNNKNKNKISLLSESEKERYQRERNEFNESIYAVMNINREILELEQTIKNNERAIEVSENLLKNPAFASRKNAVKPVKERIATLKQEKAQLDRRYLATYRNKTSAIRDIMAELNKKYVNPYIIEAIIGPLAERQQFEKSFSLSSKLNTELGTSGSAANV